MTLLISIILEFKVSRIGQCYNILKVKLNKENLNAILLGASEGVFP